MRAIQPTSSKHPLSPTKRLPTKTNHLCSDSLWDVLIDGYIHYEVSQRPVRPDSLWAKEPASFDTVTLSQRPVRPDSLWAASRETLLCVDRLNGLCGLILCGPYC